MEEIGTRKGRGIAGGEGEEKQRERGMKGGNENGGEWKREEEETKHWALVRKA